VRDLFGHLDFVNGEEQRDAALDDRTHAMIRAVRELALLIRCEDPVMEAEIRDAEMRHEARLIEKCGRRPGRPEHERGGERERNDRTIAERSRSQEHPFRGRGRSARRTMPTA
jgi:hypothetical protein